MTRNQSLTWVILGATRVNPDTKLGPSRWTGSRHKKLNRGAGDQGERIQSETTSEGSGLEPDIRAQQAPGF